MEKETYQNLLDAAIAIEDLSRRLQDFGIRSTAEERILATLRNFIEKNKPTPINTQTYKAFRDCSFILIDSKPIEAHKIRIHPPHRDETNTNINIVYMDVEHTSVAFSVQNLLDADEASAAHWKKGNTNFIEIYDTNEDYHSIEFFKSSCMNIAEIP